MGQFDTRARRYNYDEIKNPREMYIIEQLAQFKTCTEVAELYHKKFPKCKKLAPQTIRYYKETREPIIEQMREKFIAKSSMNIPIASERVRLKRTEDLYNAASNVVVKEDEKVLSAIEVSLKCLKEAREEVKGEGGTTANFLQFNQYNDLTNEQLLEKKKELEKKFIELNKKGEVYAQVQSS